MAGDSFGEPGCLPLRALLPGAWGAILTALDRERRGEDLMLWIREHRDRLWLHWSTFMSAMRSGLWCNPFGMKVRRDPYPMYARLRAREGLFPLALIDGYLASRHQDVKQIMMDPRFGSDQRLARTTGRKRGRRFAEQCEVSRTTLAFPPLIRMDGEEHRCLREYISRELMAVDRGAYGKEMVGAVERNLDRLGGGAIDFVKEVAVPVTRLSGQLILGLHERHVDVLERLLQVGLIATFGTQFLMSREVDPRSFRHLLRMRSEIRGYLSKLLQDGYDERPGVLMTVAKLVGDQRIGLETGVTLCEEVLIASFDSTVHQLSNCVRILGSQPALWDALRVERGLLGNAVEEMLRYDSAIQATSRIAKERVCWGGQWLEVGQQVVVLIGSANRDERRFENPDVCDFRRVGIEHLTFGVGRHACLGRRLESVLVESVLGVMLERFASLRLTAERLQWVREPNMRGVVALPVTFGSDS